MKSTDPVCGMMVDSNSPHKSIYQGRDVYFCAAGCKQKFDADPKKFAAKLSDKSR
jgi:Cu+-exporting ATPase